MTKKRVEQILYLAAALISGAAPVVFDPVATGLMLAAINVAMALCLQLRRD